MKKIFQFLVIIFIANTTFAQVYLNEGFEYTVFPPPYWTIVNQAGDKVWERDTNTIFEGKASAKMSFDIPEGLDWLITPKLSVSDGDEFSFWIKHMFTNIFPGNDFSVWISTTNNNTANFTSLESYEIDVDYFYEFTQKTINLSSYAGQEVYLAFRYHNFNGNGIFIDKVQGPAIVSSYHDIEVSDIFSPKDTFPGDYDVYAVIKNKGTNPIIECDIELRIDGQLTDFITLPEPINVNDSIIVVFNDVSFYSEKSYYVSVEAQYYDVYVENNIKTRRISFSNPATINYIQEFENEEDLVMWDIESTNDWFLSNNKACNGNSIRTSHQQIAGREVVLTGPYFQIPDDIDAEFEFALRYSNYLSNNNNTPDDDEFHFQLSDIDGNIIYSNSSLIENIYNLVCQTKKVDLSDFKGQTVRVQIKTVQSGSKNIFVVDDFKFQEKVIFHDVSVVKVEAEIHYEQNSLVEPITILSNNSSEEVEVAVVFTIYNVDGIVFADTVNVTIPFGETYYSVSSNESWTANHGRYTVEAEVFYELDQNPQNNIASTNINVSNVIYGQNLTSSTLFGVASTTLGAVPNGVTQTADDFELEVGYWVVDNVLVDGVSLNGINDGFMISIFDNNDDLPGEIVFEEIVYNTNNYLIPISQRLILDGQTKYWISITGYYENAQSLYEGYWEIGTTNAEFGSIPCFRDFSENYFPTNEWKTFAEIGIYNGGSRSVIFGIRGRNVIPAEINPAQSTIYLNNVQNINFGIKWNDLAEIVNIKGNDGVNNHILTLDVDYSISGNALTIISEKILELFPDAVNINLTVTFDYDYESNILINVHQANNIAEYMSNIQIFPNPAKDVINITGTENVKMIEIFSIDGKPIIIEPCRDTMPGVSKHTNSKHGISTINVSHLPNGIYIIKIHFENQIITRKLILNK